MSVEPEYLDARGVATRVGVKLATIHVYLSRGDMPLPDMVWYGRALWLVSTIDEWRRLKGKPRVRGIKRRHRPRVPDMSRRRRQPPKLAAESSSSPPLREGRPAPRKGSKAGASSDGASSRRTKRRVSEDEARELAAAVRAAGYHCTSADVLELIGVPRFELEGERELLRQRIVAQWRLLRGQ